MNIVKKVLPFLIIFILLVIIKNNISGILNASNNANATKTLTKQLEEEKKKNVYLKQRLSYVKTDQFIKDQAKEKLGLLRPGEYFVIAPTPQPLDSTKIVVDNRSNWKRWWDLFF